MKRERHLELSKVDGLKSLYGMGSFFRGEDNRDIDFVAVVDCETNRLLAVADAVRSVCSQIDWGSPRPIDVTVLTVREFAGCPLRDMDQLVLLYSSSNFECEAVTLP